MKEAAKTYLSYNEQQVLEGIVQRIPSMYPMINKIVLYGSKARGDFLEDSDIDILFVTDYAIPRAVKFEIYDAIFELEVEYSVIISAVFTTKEDFNRRKLLFMNQVHKEGITLWSRE